MAHSETADSTRPIRGSNDAEAVLLRRVVQQDRVAFQELYLIYHRRLARFLLRLTHRHDVIEEIINDSLWVVWRKAGEFRGQSTISTWIFGIAYRRALKTLRSRRSKEWFIDLVAQLPTTSVDSREQDTNHDWLSHALGELPLEQRSALELAYLYGHSCEEIAVIMECPVNTVKSRMFQARHKLQGILPRLAAPQDLGGSRTS
ncbi:MAG TPA: sigma-70 family RNA polymerase sigma factor [Steroidobacteraceae bacterium]|nr:sigma-70 family RNA polymerase sigma factor [Steroidobacteraceae bacterium]